ncbi:MAG: THUMP domain-containing protein, partial [Candidatus Bathyarchaeota archaeon]|nr:THUMP domain-containing protein [Candidatus Bathyarchaeota archaeon]
AKKISDQESYKIAVRKRSTNLSSTDIIDMIAPEIKRKVNLDNSDLLLQIEIIGEISGISLIKPNEILSVDIEKRNSHMAK